MSQVIDTLNKNLNQVAKVDKNSLYELDNVQTTTTKVNTTSYKIYDDKTTGVNFEYPATLYSHNNVGINQANKPDNFVGSVSFTKTKEYPVIKGATEGFAAGPILSLTVERITDSQGKTITEEKWIKDNVDKYMMYKDETIKTTPTASFLESD